MEYPEIRVKSDMVRYFTWLAAVWAVYVVLILFAPAQEAVNRYGLTVTEANLLRLTIAVPLFFIWLTVLFSVVRFKRYADLIKGSIEEKGFRHITKGLTMLLFAVAVPSLVSLAAIYNPGNATLRAADIIIRNYVTIGFYLAGFVYLWQASKNLLEAIKLEEWGKKYRTVVLAGVGILTFIYAWMVFNNPFRTSSSDPLVRPTYNLPDILIVLTIIIPYLLIWLFGSMAILNFWSYAKQVPGIIYRQTFRYVTQGLTVTVLFLIGLQFLVQINGTLSRATLSVILITIYILLLAIAVGYLLIARGAGKLASIEEVE